MEIRLARPDEANLLGAALADALGDDPIFRWLIPASRRRHQRLLSFFTAMSASYLQAGKPAYLADDNAGAALRSDPGTTWQLQFDLGQIRAVFGAFGTTRVVRGIRTQLQLARLHPAEPCWYLGFLGVRGARQGQGMGGALLESPARLRDRRRGQAARPRPLPLAHVAKHGRGLTGVGHSGPCAGWPQRGVRASPDARRLPSGKPSTMYWDHMNGWAGA